MQNRIDRNLQKIINKYKCTYYNDKKCITLKFTQPLNNQEIRHIQFLLNPYKITRIKAENNKLHIRLCY